VTSFFFQQIFSDAGRSSTTLHLLKHHIKPHWLQAFAPFIVNSLDHQVLHLLKLLWVLLFYASAISFALYGYILKKQLPLQCIFWKASEGSFFDLVYQIFKVKVILLFRQNGIKQIDDSCVVVCFSFSNK
jgi:hypothetical protein